MGSRGGVDWVAGGGCMNAKRKRIYYANDMDV
jgi:hypothetical protein